MQGEETAGQQPPSVTLAVIGGSGDLGGGLALRWAEAGYSVLVGSRQVDKAADAIQELTGILAQRGISHGRLEASTNIEAARAADIVVLTVPYAHHESTLNDIKSALSGKILVDVTVPLMPPKVTRVQLPPAGSAGQAAQNLLGDDVAVVSAFQNAPAHGLRGKGPVDCDVLVSGDDKAAREIVIGLVEAAGMRGLHAGPICNAAAAEALTSILININRQYRIHAGIRITGLPEST